MTFKYTSIIFTVGATALVIETQYFKKKSSICSDDSDDEINSIPIFEINTQIFILKENRTYRISRYSDNLAKKEYPDDFNYGNTVYSLFNVRSGGKKEYLMDTIKKSELLDNNRCLIDILYEKLIKENNNNILLFSEKD